MTPCERWGGRHRLEDGRPIDGRARYAYRVAWEAAHGPLPEGAVLHHRCGNAWCVNVEHLEPLTAAEHAAEHLSERNRLRAESRTHCPAGHDLAEHGRTVRSTRDGEYRRCRLCEQEAKRRYREKVRPGG